MNLHFLLYSLNKFYICSDHVVYKNKPIAPTKIKWVVLGEINASCKQSNVAHTVNCNMVFLICQTQRSCAAKIHPPCRGSLTFKCCNSVPHFPQKISDMLNEVEVNEATFDSFLCSYKTNRHPGLQSGWRKSRVCVQTSSSSSVSARPVETQLSR